MAQLGIASSAPVRVRRVNPPEIERAKLRAGERAPMRIETPSGLLTVLRRQLPDAPTTAAIRPAPIEAPVPAATPTPEPAPPAAAVATTGYYVQAGAYSERARADRVAARIDGQVYPAGRLWRVRSGPFASTAEANRDLARIRAAGFRDARVIRED
jgi:rare lipoprotein A